MPKGKKGSNRGLSSKPLRLDSSVMPVRASMKPEVKITDVTFNLSQLTANQEPILINGVTQGDDFNERVGRTTNLESVEIRMTQTSIAANTNPQFAYRTIIFYDRQTNGVAPTTAQLLQGTPYWLSYPNINYNERFVIVYDESGDVCVQGPSSKTTHGFRRLNTITKFIGTGATVADIGTGGLFALFLTSTGGDANVPSVRAYTQVKFTDP